jgi:hypothetical protein
MRSLSVSFQGESFFYKTKRAPRASSPSSPVARRGPTPERRKSVSSVPEAENARPQNRWPAAKPKASDPLARILDCSLDRKDFILAAVHLLRRSMAFDSTTSLSSCDPAATTAPELFASSDADSVSSGSSSGAGDPPRLRHQRADEVLAGNKQPPVQATGAQAATTIIWPEILGRSNVAKATGPDPISMQRKQGHHEPIKRLWWGGVTKWPNGAVDSKCTFYHQLRCRGEKGEEGGEQN